MKHPTKGKRKNKEREYPSPSLPARSGSQMGQGTNYVPKPPPKLPQVTKKETELTTIVTIVSLGNWNPTENCLLTTYHSSLVVACWWVLVHHGPRTPTHPPTHYATAIHLVKILVQGFLRSPPHYFLNTL